MNAPAKIKNIDWTGCGHWRHEMPYRAVVPIKLQRENGPMLFQVAGSDASPCGAERALRLAMKLHGGTCFYCPTIVKPNDNPQTWTLDHVEPSKLNGKSALGNLVIACRPCNQKKGHQPIETFNPTAGERWLKDLVAQAEERLQRLKK